jgi:predicted dehydrogenase
MSPMSRRSFLQSSAGAAAALTARSLLGADVTPSPSAATQSAASKLNVAAIGCLGKGESNIRLVADAGANIVALCDIDATSLGKATDHYSKARSYNDWRKMLDTQKDIDAVIVSTPDHNHAICALTAIKLGKHVYCEKPLTHNVSEVRKLMAAAREAKVATQMGNQGHSSEASHEQVEWIRAGAIGKVKEVHVWTDRPSWPQGINRPKDTPKLPDSINWDVWLGPAQERPYHPAYHPFKWRGFWDFGTGALGDMACHLMDTAYWALDLRNPSVVETFGDGMTEDSPPKWSIIRYEFPALGNRGPVKMFWYDGGMRPGMKLPADIYLPTKDGGTLLIGDGGMMICTYLRPPVFTDTEKAQSYRPPTPSIARPIQHHAQWVKAATGGPPATSNFDYSGPLTELVLLGNAAIRAQKKLEYDAASGRFTNAPDANQYLSREYRKGWEV